MASDGQKVHRTASLMKASSRSRWPAKCASLKRCAKVADRVINEGDEDERFRRRVINADLRRIDERLQHEDVGIGEKKIKTVDKKDRQRGAKPLSNLVAAPPGRDLTREPALQKHCLQNHRDPDRRRRRRHGRNREGRHARDVADSDNGKDDERLRDEARHERDMDPVEGTRDAVLRARQREQRNTGECEQERDEIIRCDAVAENENEREAGRGDRGAEPEAQKPAAGEKPAQAVEILGRAIFGNEALR